MKDLPLLSVIVPVYNILEYLPRCVHSITAQTYKNLELLLIDDGSTDGTGALCDSLAEEDSRIRVFHKPNGGSSSARNLGLKEARGEYFGFVDSDDYIEPDMYERLYQAILEAKNSTVTDPGDSDTGALPEQNNGQGASSQEYKIAQIGRNEIDEQGNPLADICVPPSVLEQLPGREFFRQLIMHKGDCSFCTKLIHRSLFEGLEFPVGELNEDFKLLIQMLERTTGVLSLPGYGYHVFYRIGSNSRKKEKDNFSQVFWDCVNNADLVEQLCASTYPEFKAQGRRFGVFQRIEYMLHIPISQMRRDNRSYKSVQKYLQKHLFSMLFNPYLTTKNKLYGIVFAICPKLIRRLHYELRLKRREA